MEIAPITNDLNFDVSVLGEAKRSAEILSIIFSIKSNCKVNIARCFSFIGPFMPLNIHYAAGNFLRDAITKKLITIKGNPKTSPLSSPIAKERTAKNKRDVINGDISVCIATIKNLSTSFLYNVQKPIQLTLPKDFL